MSLPEKNQIPITNEIGGEVAMLQATENLVSPTNLNLSHCNDNCKNDYHKYDADLPVAKVDPFTTGAYVQKCMHENVSPAVNFSRTTKMLINLWQWFLIKLEWKDLHLMTITIK